MNRFGLLAIVGLLACEAPLEPQAQTWTVEETPDPTSPVEAANGLKTFPFQAASEPILANAAFGQTGFVFEITDVFDQPGKPPELRHLSSRRDIGPGIETVWLRLPKEVFGFEAAFECPTTSESLYSRVFVAPSIEVSCTVGRVGSNLTVVFSSIDETWDHTNPRIAIGLTPDKMLYEWRLKSWQDGEFPEIFHFAYLIDAPSWTEDSTYGGYRL
jgi:hypothetical protein